MPGRVHRSLGEGGYSCLHTSAADNPKFGDQLSKQALQNDKIEGEKGAEGSKEYIRRQSKD